MGRRRVVVLGNSVIVATVAASLRRFSHYEVISASLSQMDNLGVIEADVVLFDLEAARPEAAFSLLETRPGLMLIGISPDSNLVKMWTGRELRELSTKELVEVIDEQTVNTDISSAIKEGGG